MKFNKIYKRNYKTRKNLIKKTFDYYNLNIFCVIYSKPKFNKI